MVNIAHLLKIEGGVYFGFGPVFLGYSAQTWSSELVVALPFVPVLHFLQSVTDQRTRCGKHPTAFRTAIAAKSFGREPYKSPRDEGNPYQVSAEKKREGRTATVAVRTAGGAYPRSS